MTPKQIKSLLTKRDGHYAYFDSELETWVVFHKSWSLTKCRKYMMTFLNLTKRV